jgi:carbon storage regulator CsrA
VALTLRRKRGEAIKIGDNIIITISDTRDSHAQIRVEAPREIPIQRIQGEAGNGNANNTGAASRKRRRH